MSRFTKYGEKAVANDLVMENSQVENFMGGTSYKLNPLDTLKLIASSSIFGEPSYYRKNKEQVKNIVSFFKELDVDLNFNLEGTTDIIFEKAIDASLDYDYFGTLEYAVQLRNVFYMRLNPAVIFVRAIRHKNRKLIVNNPRFSKLYSKVLLIPTDARNSLDYLNYVSVEEDKKVPRKGKKRAFNIPAALWRSWKTYLEKKIKTDSYYLNKYRSDLIDLFRLAHVKIDTPMLTDFMDRNISPSVWTTNYVPETEITWNQLRSKGMPWVDILKKIRIPHMALLKNLAAILKDTPEKFDIAPTLKSLIDGVKGAKQFPFRYYSAYKVLENIYHPNVSEVLDALNICMEVSLENFPKLSGRTLILCDNSGSTSERITNSYNLGIAVHTIGNLSGIMTARNSDSAVLGVFGDRVSYYNVLRTAGILTQLNTVEKLGTTVGARTENGIWDHFKNSTEFFDNIFIYSDQQAGHGGLYTQEDLPEEFMHNPHNSARCNYIDVYKLILKYRKEINPKVNVFSVSIAGYDNSLLPENFYRGAILSGWTGNEVLFAKTIIDFWDEKEKK